MFMYMLCHVKMIDSIMCNPESTVFVKNKMFMSHIIIIFIFIIFFFFVFMSLRMKRGSACADAGLTCNDLTLSFFF